MAGSYTKANICPSDPFIIVHPPGYDGMGGDITVEICIAPNTPSFALPALQNAVDIWNSLATVSPNCEDCLVWEEEAVEPLDESYDLSSGLIHELGHCAMGLGHPNHANTSFTVSRQDCPDPSPLRFRENTAVSVSPRASSAGETSLNVNCSALNRLAADDAKSNSPIAG